MRNFVILLFILGLGLSIADNVLADTLYGLYGDNSASSINQLNRNSYQNSKQSKKKNKKSKKSSKTNNLSKQTTQYNYNYMPNYSQPQPDAFRDCPPVGNRLPRDNFKHSRQAFAEPYARQTPIQESKQRRLALYGWRRRHRPEKISKACRIRRTPDFLHERLQGYSLHKKGLRRV